ncbi:hypothetical protein GIB67_031401 [Kingdonia uniflora]|uniref:Uncharacterized protein n=1 Tax=Kingdonia uniflora TaxID=39325 RepID=A0A7J7MB43_9MAGN|nr:hypothetical protein GIB67_031401 [Kingdonia uniflora]
MDSLVDIFNPSVSSLAPMHPLYCLQMPTQSEIYIVDPRYVEHVLKTNFSNYGKGQYNFGIMKDLFVMGSLWLTEKNGGTNRSSRAIIFPLKC